MLWNGAPGLGNGALGLWNGAPGLWNGALGLGNRSVAREVVQNVSVYVCRGRALGVRSFSLLFFFFFFHGVG